ncbi:MAG: family 16 glycosylhydrolase [Bacteroidales bacterium]|nr:family 16 glycosylhydrolase [Bacteroidales bacterium]
MKKIFFLFTLTLAMVAISGSCTKSEEVIPELNLPESVIISEGTETQNIALITFTLSQKAENEVVIKWSTIDGTAVQGEDYEGHTDVNMTFAKGETEKTVEIAILTNDIHGEDKTFSVIITNVKNAKLGNSQCVVTIEDDDDFIPELILQPVYKINEGTAEQITLSIPVKLSGASVNPVTLQWATIEAWAKSNEDFIPVTSAQLEFSPGETEKNIEVLIVNDNIFEMDDFFDVQLTAIQGATFENNSARVYILNDDLFMPEMNDDGPITPLTYPGMQLVWNDEFDGSSINTSDWGYDLGAGGWGNNEWQTYTNLSANSFVSDGKLNIVATQQYGNYYSARMLTKGKKEFTYGRIDLRARMPYGKGIWPALWMLGGNIGQVGWPRCGEIDIMEYLGHIQSQTHGTVHYYESGHKYKGSNYTLPDNQSFHDGFHVFSIVWQENSIKWYVDYQLFYQVTDSDISFDAFRLPQFFIFNVAVGGNWPGYPDATTVFPQTMQVDYVRVFQQD